MVHKSNETAKERDAIEGQGMKKPNKEAGAEMNSNKRKRHIMMHLEKMRDQAMTNPVKKGELNCLGSVESLRTKFCSLANALHQLKTPTQTLPF